MTIKKLKELEKILNYRFKNKDILVRALTHSSYVNENKLEVTDSNERLEFLGDAILGLIVSEHLYKKYPHYPEGELTKLRAKIVCEQSLAYVAKKYSIGQYLLLGKGEEATGGRDRVSILADTVEAIIGAVYLDSSYEKVRKVLLSRFEKDIAQAVSKGILFVDYKTELQEKVQKNGSLKIEYNVEREEGPDHGKIFYMNVVIDDKKISVGKGTNKKEAEQNAAKKALDKLGDSL